MKNLKDMKIESTYPAYDDWLSKNMSELKKSVAHLPVEETADIIEVAGRMIWLAAQQQEGYVMVPVEPTSDMLKSGNAEREGKCCCTESIYKAMIQEAQE